LQSFIGLASYYRKYVKNFSKIASPLHRATASNNKLEWNQEREEAFEKQRNCLTSESILALPDFKKEFKLETDASNYGVDAVLSQVVDEGERLVAYFSRHLNSTKLRVLSLSSSLFVFTQNFKVIKKIHIYLYRKSAASC
jgi:hypothetical protein